ncbi:MAG: hypothetical protein IJR46_03715 [Neisseriaceae bacterium]|nr:hypothetical protein [Neisseriaceae bacterium]
MNKKDLIRWLIVLIIPAITIIYFHLIPAKDSTEHLINGIILACEATFLFKFILFAIIGHHLRGEHQEKKRQYFLFIPIILLILYTIYYFQTA